MGILQLCNEWLCNQISTLLTFHRFSESQTAPLALKRPNEYGHRSDNYTRWHSSFVAVATRRHCSLSPTANSHSSLKHITTNANTIKRIIFFFTRRTGIIREIEQNEPSDSAWIVYYSYCCQALILLYVLLMFMMARDSTRWQVATYPTFSQLRHPHVSIIVVVIFTFSADTKKKVEERIIEFNGMLASTLRTVTMMMTATNRKADEDVVRTNVKSASKNQQLQQQRHQLDSQRQCNAKKLNKLFFFIFSITMIYS